ncbi:MAG: putative bifunctional diguanylate cyclase/phosphodiesterase [Parahaliea sp.]
MTTANKLNTLIFLFLLVATMVMGALLVAKRYQIALGAEIDAVSSRVERRADLQWLLYRSDSMSLKRILTGLAENSHLVSLQAHAPTGEQLMEVGSVPLPGFSELRGTMSPIDRTINRGMEAEPLIPYNLMLDWLPFYRSWLDGDKYIYISLPIVGTINPATRHLTTYDFLADMIKPSDEGANFVMGFVSGAIELKELRQQALDEIGQLILIWLIPVSLAFLLTLWWTNASLHNLRELANAISRIADGKFKYKPGLTAGSEFHEIAADLNELNDNVQRHEQEIRLGRDLLSRKVEERTSQLSRSHEELNRAAEVAVVSQQRLEQLTYYDALTTLPNRRLFMEQFGLLMRLSHRTHQPMALCYIDIDNFKRINTNISHIAGDHVLREAAKRITHCVRHISAAIKSEKSQYNLSASRIGGNEFAVVITQLETPAAASLVVEDILEALAKPITFEVQDITIKASIGVAIYPGNGDSPSALLNAATTAMYKARENRHEDFLFFQRDMAPKISEHQTLEGELRHAVAEKNLSLHYQAQIDTIMGSVVSIEALLRWNHPVHGPIPPTQIIAAAEELGIMDKIGDWALEEACRSLKSIKPRVAQLPRVAVNISPAQMSANFGSRVLAILSQVELPPDRLELSFAEPLLRMADQEMIATLERLRTEGVYISMNGYGRGQSSLLQLSAFPADELKIEREFLTDRRDNGRSGALLSLINTARSLGLKSCAEGVETARDYKFLSENGVKQMQGHLFCKAIALNDLLPMLAPWHFSEQIRKMGMDADSDSDV